MQRHSEYRPIHTVLIPLVHGGPGLHALEAARHLYAEIILVGVVVIPEEQSLSIGTVAARELRKQLRELAKDERITIKSQPIVSYQPWNEIGRASCRERV